MASSYWSGYYQISFHELARTSGLSITEIEELVDLGVLVPQGQTAATWVFSAHTIITMAACRLRHDFELDVTGGSLILAYLNCIHELEARLQTLECQYPD